MYGCCGSSNLRVKVCVDPVVHQIFNNKGMCGYCGSSNLRFVAVARILVASSVCLDAVVYPTSLTFHSRCNLTLSQLVGF